MIRVRRVVSSFVAVLLLGGWVARAAPLPDSAANTRLIVVKVDGLPQDAVDAYVNRIDPRTGRSVLPWIRHLYYESGVRTENFYSRGISLSEPSWAIIDTGQHSLVKGNFEADRNTGDTVDHLSFVGFYLDSAKSQRVFPPAIEALDACRTPLTSDAWQFEDRETGIQLLRRGTLWFELFKVGIAPASRGTIGKRVGDILIGVNETEIWAKVSEERFVEAVRDPAVRYADFYWPFIDEALHDDNSEASLRGALSNFDRMLGRVQQAIAESGTADRTVLAVVSDHGSTYDVEGKYSQGINLIGYLERPEFGAHHSMSRGGPLANYELEGSALKPFASAIALTASRHSFYLADRPGQITCAMDYDGNERAQLYLRDPDLARLQMLWRALRAGKLDARSYEVAGRGAMAILDRRRAGWSAEAFELGEELVALARRGSALRREQAALEAETKRARPRSSESSAGIAPFAGRSALNHRDPYRDLVDRGRELAVEVFRTDKLRNEYGAFRNSLATRSKVVSVEAFVAADETALFGFREFGRTLDARDLAAYPVRLRDIVATDAGALDERASFVTVNYLEAFTGIRIRNSASAERGTAPVSWIVAEMDAAATVAALGAAGRQVQTIDRAFLVSADRDRQLLMLYRTADDGRQLVTLAPISRFSADSPTGAYEFDLAAWRSGLPFGLFEDESLKTGGQDRSAWLSAEHDLISWRDGVHRTAEGLAVVGFTEVATTAYRQRFDELIARATQADDKLLLRFERRRRDAVATDLFLHAAPHWNFDLKDFNAGGNHGGFGRSSMHTVFWIRGGAQTRIQAGPIAVQAPYDGLDVAPTLMEASGLTTGGALTDELKRGGFRSYPGSIVREAFRP